MQRKSKIFASPDGKKPDIWRFDSEGLGHDGVLLKDLSQDFLFSWAYDLTDWIIQYKNSKLPLIKLEIKAKKKILSLIKRVYPKN